MAITAVGALGQDQFLQLLVAQLQNQDPLDPVAPDQFIAQLATLSSVQGIQALNVGFSEMLRMQQLSQGVDLVGKTVEYVPFEGGENVTGRVESLTAENGQFVLMIGGVSVGLDQLVSVRA